MNLSDYTYLLNHPDKVTPKDTEALDTIVTEFPYFQSARALRLKGLYLEDSFRYNYALKVTAAYTMDRGVLFDFITTNQFQSVTRDIFAHKRQELLDLNVSENVSEIVTAEPDEDHEEAIIAENDTFDTLAEAAEVETVEPETVTNLPDPATLSILESIREATVQYTVVEPEAEVAKETPTDTPDAVIPDEQPLATEVSERLEIGKPLGFEASEMHSFQEWLQLSSFRPIERTPEADTEIVAAPENTNAPETDVEAEAERQKKKNLIDKFIENNPKIPAPKKDIVPPVLNVEPSRAVDNSYLMTETLARVYLEQKKYDKAIQAYEILILKYPEKSSFFADRILDIKTLKNNPN